MFLKKLTEACGLPGFENEVRNLIKAEIAPYCDSLLADNLGNLIAVKNQDSAGKHTALSAHMDEVGLVVRGITEEGFLRIGSWGVDPRILVAKTVLVGKNKLPGVIGSRPVHLIPVAERGKAIKIEDLYIDLGARTKKEAEKLVSIGDFAAFQSDYLEFGSFKVKAKALDDRVGCAIITDVLKSNTKDKITAVFCVQEEVGLRGSQAAANRVSADLVLNLEGTLCADTAETPEHLWVTTQGMGPAISISDRSSVYQKKYVESIVELAKSLNIPCQYRRTNMGMTDAKNFHMAHGGTPVIGIAVPCRYIHSPVSVMDIRDFENTGKLVAEYIEYFNRG